VNISKRLVKHVFYPLALWRSGDASQLRWLKEFERTQYLTGEALRDLQFRRLRQLLEHAWERCPFYRTRFEQAGVTPGDIRSLEDLSKLPPLEKVEIQERMQDMLACGWPESDLIRNQTGGSTGTPVVFYLDRERQRSRAAATIRHNRWAGWDVGDAVAVLWGAARDAPRQDWRARLRRTLLGQPLWLDTAHVNAEKFAGFHQLLLRRRPKIIQAYARSLLLFAQFLNEHGLKPWSPHSIVTSAESLEPPERTLVEQTFGCPVFNRYGCREVSVVASECPAHSLHVMAEGLYVEIVRDNHSTAPGEIGSVLVTDLLNRAMPLIRYRIGDLASWDSEPCRCGRVLPRLKELHGRVTDFLVGADGRLVSGVFLATYMVAQRPTLGQVQIVQERAGAVSYRIRPGKAFRPEEDLPYLERTSREHLGDTVRVSWEFVDDLPREPSGKFIFSRSSVALEQICGPKC